MDIQTATLVPPLTALAAALAAGGIAYSNLIVSKDIKTSEFRQAWINGLRDELSAFLANTRTMARAVQEARVHHSQEDSKLREVNAKFHINAEKITEIRHSVADTFYKIKLRLNPNQLDHAELLRLLEAVTATQNNYLANLDADIESVFQADGAAAAQAARVLKSEWERVKSGETGYRRALRSASSLLVAIVVLLFALGAIVFFGDGSAKSVAKRTPVESAAATTATATNGTAPVVAPQSSAKPSSAPK